MIQVAIVGVVIAYEVGAMIAARRSVAPKEARHISLLRTHKSKPGKVQRLLQFCEIEFVFVTDMRRRHGATKKVSV